jgi:hypothetical protein
MSSAAQAAIAAGEVPEQVAGGVALVPVDDAEVAEAPPPAAVAEAPPPYTETTDIAFGVTCYKCDKQGFTTWGSVMEHLRNRHKVPVASLHGTYLYTAATADLNARRKERYDKKKLFAPARAAATAAVPSPHVGDAELMQDPAVRMNDGAVVRGENGIYWRAMWVMCEGGRPIIPAVLEEIEHFELTAKHLRKEAGGVIVPAPAAHPPATAPVPAVAAFDELKDILRDIKGNSAAWKQGLPSVRLNPVFVACIHPEAKGEGWPNQEASPLSQA